MENYGLRISFTNSQQEIDKCISHQQNLIFVPELDIPARKIRLEWINAYDLTDYACYEREITKLVNERPKFDPVRGYAFYLKDDKLAIVRSDFTKSGVVSEMPVSFIQLIAPANDMNGLERAVRELELPFDEKKVFPYWFTV